MIILFIIKKTTNLKQKQQQKNPKKQQLSKNSYQLYSKCYDIHQQSIIINSSNRSQTVSTFTDFSKYNNISDSHVWPAPKTMYMWPY